MCYLGLRKHLNNFLHTYPVHLKLLALKEVAIPNLKYSSKSFCATLSLMQANWNWNIRREMFQQFW